MASPIQYIHLSQTKEGDWVPIGQFHWNIPADELAITYAAHTIRLEAMTPAEADLKGYHHGEPLKIGGRTKVVRFLSAVEEIKKPFLVSMKSPTGTPQALEELSEKLAHDKVWKLSKESGLQAIASIGWLADVTKARPPDITKDTSAIEYEIDLLPENLEVKEESSPSGYNDRQLAMIIKAHKIVSAALKNCGTLGKNIAEMGPVPFGERIFKTYSRIFTSLPDPEAEEREKFEAVRQQAKEKREAEDE